MYFWTLIPHCPRNHTKRVNVYGITQTICRSVAHTFTHRTVLCTRVYFVNHISRDKCALYVCVIVLWCDARLSANSYMFSYNNKENIVAEKEDLYFPRQKPNSKRFSWALISVRFRWTTWTLVLLFDHFIDIIFFSAVDRIDCWFISRSWTLFSDYYWYLWSVHLLFHRIYGVSKCAININWLFCLRFQKQKIQQNVERRCDCEYNSTLIDHFLIEDNDPITINLVVSNHINLTILMKYVSSHICRMKIWPQSRLPVSTSDWSNKRKR